MSEEARTSQLGEGSDTDSGPEDRTPPSKKAKSDSASASSNKDENKFMLSEMRLAWVKKFRGKAWVDIREFYSKDGELKPGKKGICLNKEQWRALRRQMDDIDAALNKL